MQDTRFDVLVVGGGSAGCVLAARLSESGRRVCHPTRAHRSRSTTVSSPTHATQTFSPKASRPFASSPVATCAIGRVVDGSGRVYGIDGLFVGDASIMPTIPRANTNLSTLAVAERIAESVG